MTHEWLHGIVSLLHQNPLKWVPKGVKQDAIKPGLGLGTSPVMTDPLKCPFFPVLSGPSFLEVNEGSFTSKGSSTQAPVKSFGEFGSSARCVRFLMEADDPVFVGSSFGEPTTTLGEVDDHP